MNNRFEELLGLLLDGEPSSDELAELVRLAEDDPARQEEIQAQLEAAEMITLSEDELRDPSLFLNALQSRLTDDPFVSRIRTAVRFGGSTPRRAILPWSIAAAAMLALLLAGFFLLRSNREPIIAELMEAEGALRWTGAGGQVDETLAPGRLLTGGTIEGLGPNASATLRFPDETTVTISGRSILTISDSGQKILHFEEGRLAAEIALQSREKPLILHTAAAALQVSESRFEVDASSVETRVTVTDGAVQLVRSTDQQTLQIAAAHHATVSLGSTEPIRLEDVRTATHSWRAKLQKEVDHGEWVSGSDLARRRVEQAVQTGEMTEKEAWAKFQSLAGGGGMVLAMPMRGDGGGVSFVASFVPEREQRGPVLLKEGARFRVSGRVHTDTGVRFRFAAQNPEGTKREWFVSGRMIDEGEFRFDLPLSEFKSRVGKPEEWELLTWYGEVGAREDGLKITSLELVEE